MTEKYIVTGCDLNTEWQLPWFVSNLKSVYKGKLIIADFGMTPEMRRWASKNSDYVMDVEGKGWFSKIETMVKVQKYFFGDFCWLDTDCQVNSDPSGIFNYVLPNKLTMVVDHPWTENGSPWTPQGNCGPWYNTGVVAFKREQSNTPLNILGRWLDEVRQSGVHRGDQEAIYHILNEHIQHRMLYVSEAPHRFNTLRLDVEQGRVAHGSSPVVMHWTGAKGNKEIWKQVRAMGHTNL
jgi:hypothetical protein